MKSESNNTVSHEAVYPGSFDPLTMGHINVMRRALTIFEKIYCLVAISSQKTCFFSLNERVNICKQSLEPEFKNRIIIQSSKDLLVDYLEEKKIFTVVRGVRHHIDLQYELSLAHAYKTMNKSVNCVFFPTDTGLQFTEGKYIRSIMQLGGNYTKFIAANAREYIEQLLKNKLNTTTAS